jgi:ElaB/YqjD/DUF883 family membrane-anchored ribosome-binding protein
MTMTARNVEQEFDALKADFGKLSTDLANLTTALREATGQGASDYLAKLRGAMEHANGDVQAAAAALGARGREGMDAAAEHVRERPLTSILVCFGLGLVVGKLLDR